MNKAYMCFEYEVGDDRFVVYCRGLGNKKCTAHLLIRDYIDGVYDNLEVIHGDITTIIVEKLNNVELSYGTMTAEIIQKLKLLVLRMIMDDDIGENVKAFVDDVGGYRYWNLEILNRQVNSNI